MLRVADPPESLLLGRRALDSIPDVVQLVQDWRLLDGSAKWVLCCRITVESANEALVPRSSDWFIVVDQAYPEGEIAFYPAKDGGIQVTFHHQLDNDLGEADLPWRCGKICLDTGARALGRTHYDPEPLEASERLKWNVLRAKEWLLSASRNALVLPGEPFELPHFRTQGSTQFAFNESPASMAEWCPPAGTYGFAELVNFSKKLTLVRSFTTFKGEVVRRVPWGKAICEASVTSIAGWLLASKLPVIKPWQAPRTWHELQAALQDQGIDLMEITRQLAHRFRDGKPHLLLIGFPIPSTFDGPDYCLHWQALELPLLSYGSRFRKGFRKSELGYWMRDTLEVLRPETPLNWVSSHNWASQELASRGQLPEVVTKKHALLIGAGALGSCLAECLVRSGLGRLTIVDPDLLLGGNLVRHTLSMSAVGYNKALALAYKLNGSTPHASVEAIRGSFPEDMSEAKLKEFDVVIDCTGNDRVLKEIGCFPWKDSALLFSVSVGIGCKRLYVMSAATGDFSYQFYEESITPWLDRDVAEYGSDLPWEGVGCWHPVFPARSDDAWLFASCACKMLEQRIMGLPSSAELYVFSQVYRDSGFMGVELVDHVTRSDCIRSME